MKLALWAVLAGLLALIYLQWRDWPPDGRLDRVPELAAPGPAGPSLELAPDLLAQLEASEEKAAYTDVVDRPLFLPDRRPADEEPLAEQAPPEPDAQALEGLDLTAVIMTPQETTAWVLGGPVGSLTKIRPGEDIAGWLVQEIRPDRLVLERQGETDTLLLRTYSSPRLAPDPRAQARSPRSPARRLPRVRNRQ